MSPRAPGLEDDEDRLYAAESGTGEAAPFQEEAAGAPYQRAGPRERKLVFSINSALRVSRLHALDNVVAQEALGEMAGLLAEYLTARSQVQLLATENRLYVNGGALRRRKQGHSWLADFLEFLARMGIGGMTFKGRWDLAAARVLLESFARVGPQSPEERLEIVRADLAQRLDPAAQLELLSLGDAAQMVSAEDEEEAPDADRATLAFARLLALIEAAHAAVRAGRSPDGHERPLRQTIMTMVESLRTGSFQLRLLGLTALPHPEQDPFAGHAVNVCVLSLAMGRLLGLSRGNLSDLGYAALFHDLGRAVVGREPATTQPGERLRTAQAHVIVGVTASLRGKGFGDAGLLRLVVAQETHRVVDGYPEDAGLRRPHLFSRIVAVADTFDRLCQGTPWAAPLSPARALEKLAEPTRTGQRFEPALVQLLRDVLGPCPRGTILSGPTGELVVVVDGGARRQGRPVTRRLLLSDGSPDPQGALSELRDVDAWRVVEPQAVDLDWARALLA